jgi:uncharacterized protein (TIGR00304 family)
MRREPQPQMDAGTLYNFGLALIFIGTVVVIIAALLLSMSKVKGKGETRGGGAIIIGPVPIIFGTDEKSIKTILILSLVLTMLLLIVTVTLHFTSK